MEYTKDHLRTYQDSYESTRRRAKIAAVIDTLGEVADKRVLDVGSGSGYWTTYLQRCGARVVSLDRHDPMIRDLSADAESLPFRDRTFDLVLLLDVIEHVENPRACLMECRRVLQEGGRLILVTDNTRPILQKILAPIDKLLRMGAKAMCWFTRRRVPTLRTYAPCTHTREFSSDEIRGLTEGVGFHIRRAYTFSDSFAYYSMGRRLGGGSLAWDHVLVEGARLQDGAAAGQ